MSEQNTNTDFYSKDEGEISLIDIAIALGEEKKALISLPIFTTALAIVVSLLMTPIFTAKTVVMLPQQQQSGLGSALTSLGALAGLAGGASVAKSSEEMYISFMQGESIQKAVIQKLKLQERYDKKSIIETRELLKEKVKITSDKKSGLILVEASDKDPEFAATLANTHVEELRNLVGRLAITEAQQRRLFYERAIQKTQNELVDLEAKFRSAREKSGMLVTAVIAETSVRTGAEIRAQIALKEVQLMAMNGYATSKNADVQRIAGELASLRSHLNKLERGTGDNEISSPSLQTAVKLYREIKAHEAMLAVLVAQYETARLEEAKEGPLIQQVDVAVPPELRSKPKRMLIVLFSAFAGLFFGGLLAYLLSLKRKVRNKYESNGKLDLLRSAWKIK